MTSGRHAEDARRVMQALNGSSAAVRALVESLTPVVRARVARVLLRRSGAAQGRDVRQELDDLTQDVFVALFEQKGKVLQSWSPDGGLSLANFVGLVAERRTHSTLRSRRQSPWSEDPTDPVDFQRSRESGPGPEGRIAERDLLRAVLERLRAGLSPKGLRLFELILVEQRPVPEVCAAMNMKAAAVYAWRSRLAKQARAAREAVLSEVPSAAGGV